MEEELELERQLKLINKPPVKSIQSEFGYIVDCVDINKQLAFDHPLLKDHKIQERPSFSLRGTKNDTKEDLIAIRSLSSSIYPQNAAALSVHTAIIQMLELPGRSYTEVQGNINVYIPDVKDGASFGEIHVINGAKKNTNAIRMGCMTAQMKSTQKTGQGAPGLQKSTLEKKSTKKSTLDQSQRWSTVRSTMTSAVLITLPHPQINGTTASPIKPPITDQAAALIDQAVLTDQAAAITSRLNTPSPPI
ncbi:hypothetical protein SO802_008854 [Lithocarpus litseifolius]|uniref:Neprosin activation peptide domain-containing protein n=1 Tax=Lithocarpus litseifolius TaxID=425828 RepID=A0AAW2DBY6_9ROSI